MSTEIEKEGANIMRQSDIAMQTLLAREIWRYNECPWDFDNPAEGMAQLQKQLALDQAVGLLDVIFGSALFKAKFTALLAALPALKREESVSLAGATVVREEIEHFVNRITEAKTSWLPIAGHVVSLTFTLNERDALLALLAQAEAKREESENV